MQSVSSNAVAQSLTSKSNVIKYKEVRINSITINSDGYLDITSYFPSGMNNFLFCQIWSFGHSYNGHCFNVSADGLYLLGESGDFINYVILRYYYTD